MPLKVTHSLIVVIHSTVFLRSDAMGTIFFFTVHVSAATIQGGLLIEGGTYFIGKLADSNDD